MNRTNVVRRGQSASPAPASGLKGPSPRHIQIRDYQNMARIRLRERLTGSPTAATFYDLLMQDQLTSIKLNSSHA